MKRKKLFTMMLATATAMVTAASLPQIAALADEAPQAVTIVQENAEENDYPQTVPEEMPADETDEEETITVEESVTFKPASTAVESTTTTIYFAEEGLQDCLEGLPTSYQPEIPSEVQYYTVTNDSPYVLTVDENHVVTAGALPSTGSYKIYVLGIDYAHIFNINLVKLVEGPGPFEEIEAPEEDKQISERRMKLWEVGWVP